MEPTKQVIVVRKDLKMKGGKLGPQVAHASNAAIFKLFDVNTEDEFVNTWKLYLPKDHPACNWMIEQYTTSAKFTKICLAVNSESELFDIYNKAKAAGLLCSIIQDSGKTTFNGVPTYTCVGIGPDFVDKIDVVTGHLPLL